MTDDRELLPDDHERDDDPTHGIERGDDDYDLLSTEDFDDALQALEQTELEDADTDELDDADSVSDELDESNTDDAGDDDANAAEFDRDDLDHDDLDGDELDDEDAASEELVREADEIAAYSIHADATEDEERAADDEFADDLENVPESIDDDERLRGPRAQRFRRRRQNRIAFLPLALYLLALGSYLIAREQDAENLREFSNLAIIGASVVMGAFTMIFHSLLSGRRERGLLVLGLWIGATVGLIAALVHFVDDHPDAVEWWPLLVGALGLALFVNYMIERTHDARLLWLGFIALFAAGIAYAFTSNTIDEDTFSQFADYWPLLLSVIGIGVVPLVFRRHLE